MKRKTMVAAIAFCLLIMANMSAYAEISEITHSLQVSELLSFPLVSGATAHLNSTPISYAVKHGDTLLHQKGELFYVDIRDPNSGNSRRIWQEIFNEANYPYIHSFMLRLGQDEHMLCFGYIEDAEVFVCALDTTKDLERFEILSLPVLQGIDARFHQHKGHPNSLGLYNFFSSDEFLERTDSIAIEDLSYFAGEWMVTLRLSGNVFRLHGEMQEKTVRWAPTEMSSSLKIQEREVINVLQTFFLPSGEKAILSSHSVRFILGSPDGHSNSSQLYGILFFIDIESPFSGKRWRVWQEIFETRFPICQPANDSFVFSSTKAEQIFCFGYLQGYDVFVYLLDATKSLLPLEQTSPIFLTEGDPRYHVFLGHMNGSVGVPRLFREKDLGALAEEGGKIETLTYSDNLWNLTLQFPDQRIHFRGESGENAVRWSIIR